MKRDVGVFLEDIIESIELIEKRTKKVSRKKFVEDVDLQDMVIRRFEIIGEAVRNLPKEFRKEYSDIDWQDAGDMRSVLIHGYFAVDLDENYNTFL